MCIVSMVLDDFYKRNPTIPNHPWVSPGNPSTPIVPNPLVITPNPAIENELQKLRQELEALKDLIKAAKIFDEKTGQPDCEVDEKVEALKKIAECLGVDISGAFE